ncbi:MAG: hypothetical protein KDD61_08785 [Bdellovibrionales bacterium]|nr:hypothetical protein [Bdellovibrionales bacterium]
MFRFLTILSLLFFSSCANHATRMARWTGCGGDVEERLLGESIGMRTVEATCDGKVMICKYSTFGFGQCRPKEDAYKEGNWTQPQN